MVLDVKRMPRPYVHFKNQNPNNYLKRTGVPARLSLGELLFRSPLILGKKAQKLGLSCNSCHPNGDQNADFFLPGNSSRPGTVDLTHKMFSAEADNGRKDALRIPSLRGVRYLAPYGHAGRIQSLREFNRHVIVNAFAGPEPEALVLDSLTDYLRQLEFLPNKHLGSNNRLVRKANHGARQGEIVFNNACASCHMPSAFFRDGRIHRLGSKKYAETSPWSFEGGVKTPTLINLNSKLMFHNADKGSFEQVLKFKQMQLKLRLTVAQQDSIMAYLKLVTARELPYDQRHLAERMVELGSLLRIFQNDRVARKQSELILNSIAFVIKKEAGQSSNAESRAIVQKFLKRLSSLKALPYQEQKKKALALESWAQEKLVYFR